MTWTWSGSRARVIAGVALAVTGCAWIVACGGGTDIAPSEPSIDGVGSASVLLGTLDLGASTQVDAGVSGVVNAPGTVTDEVVTVRPDGFIVLANGSLSSPIVTLTGPGGAPTYCQGVNAACVGTPTCAVPPSTTPTIPCDFWLADASVGLLQVSPSGTIPAAPATLEADYSFSNRLLTLGVGVTFPNGQFVTLTIFNLASTAVPPRTINLTVSTAPAAPHPEAFYVSAQTNLTRPTGRELFTTIEGDPANTLTLTDIDLTNEANPCVAGTGSVQVRSDADPTPVTLDFSFAAPGC